MEKVYVDRQVFLGLFYYFYQIDMSMARLFDLPEDSLVEFYQSRILPKKVIEVLKKHKIYEIDPEMDLYTMYQYLSEKKRFYPSSNLFRNFSIIKDRVFNCNKMFILKEDISVISFALKEFDFFLANPTHDDYETRGVLVGGIGLICSKIFANQLLYLPPLYSEIKKVEYYNQHEIYPSISEVVGEKWLR